jgi:thioredoxin-related protein
MVLPEDPDMGEKTMKRTLMLGVAAVIGLSAVSAGAASGWEDNFDKAAERAKTEGRYMLVDFSGSDWCGWCVKLDEEVFSKKSFKDFAKDNLVLALVDFPRHNRLSKNDKERNEALAKKHGVRGFPTVLIMSPEGEVIGKTGYKPGGPETYVKHVQDFIEAHRAKSGGEKKAAGA